MLARRVSKYFCFLLFMGIHNFTYYGPSTHKHFGEALYI